jgi:hypothetical protein
MTRAIYESHDLLDSIRKLGVEISQEEMDSLVTEALSPSQDDNELDKKHPLTRVFYKLSKLKESSFKIEIRA